MYPNAQFKVNHFSKVVMGSTVFGNGSQTSSVASNRSTLAKFFKVSAFSALCVGNLVFSGNTWAAAGVTYSAHVASIGWLGWMSNGMVAGTEGQNRRMEAVMIKTSGSPAKICYQAHVAGKGWLPTVCDGAIAGTTGESRQMEAVKIWLENAPVGCTVEYQAHVASLGWLNIVSNGNIAGTTGQSRRMEAVKVWLKGNCELPQIRKGLTWGKVAHDAINGIDAINCSANGVACDPYQGDTACSTALPILCGKQDGSPRPNYVVAPSGGGMPKQFYRGWFGGHIATTLPIKGTALTSQQVADASCAAAFGDGWKMAWHGDGKWVKDMDLNKFYGTAPTSPSPWPATGQLEGGWGFFAFGNVTDKSRFWVRIQGQKGNCWDK